MLVDLREKKGSYFLAKIFKENLTNYNLTIVGTKKNLLKKNIMPKILIILVRWLNLIN